METKTLSSLVIACALFTSNVSAQTKQGFMRVNDEQKCFFTFEQGGNYKFTIMEVVTPSNDGPGGIFENSPKNSGPHPVDLCMEGECNTLENRCLRGLLNGNAGNTLEVHGVKAGCHIAVWKYGAMVIAKEEIRNDPDWRGNEIIWEGDGYKVRVIVEKL